MAKFNPKNALALAKSLEKSGKAKGAASEFARVGVYLCKKHRFEEAGNVLKRAIQLSPSSLRVYVHLAIAEEGQGNAAQAEESAETFSREALRSGSIDRYTDYVEQHWGPYPRFRIAFFSAILSLDRTSSAPFVALGKALCEEGRYDEAKHLATEALRVRDGDPYAMELLHLVLAAEGGTELIRAAERYRSGKLDRSDFLLLLEAKPRDATQVSTVGADKNLKTLISELEREIGGGVEERDTVAPLLQEFRRQAEPVFTGDSRARMDIALAYFEMGLFAVSREEVQKIALEDPLYWEAQCLLGQIYCAEGSELRALEVYLRCLREASASLEVVTDCRYQLVLLYVHLGDGKQAIEHLEQLEKIAPNYRNSRQLKEQASRLAQ